MTNGLSEPVIALQGQNDYATLNAAQDGAETELLSLAVLLPSNELIPVGTIIYQTGNLYSNAVKARTQPTSDGDYIDWRFLRLGGSAVGQQNDHNALFNLTVGDPHTQYMFLNGRSGGQVLIGGTAPLDDITFETSSDAAKGDYVFSEMTVAGVLKNDVNGVVTGGNDVDLTSDVTNELPVVNGGTGQNTAQLGFDALAPTTTKGDLITRDSANNVRVPVGDDGQSIIADSATSEGWKWGNVSGSGGFAFDYRFSTAITPPPTDKKIIYDSVGQINATQMHVDNDTDSGADIHNILSNLAIGDRILLVKNNDAGQYQEWSIDQITDNTTYVSYDITLVTSDGALFLNNDRIVFAVFGGSSGSVTRQNTYDNSGTPQTVTSDAKGKVVTKRGTAGGDTDDVWEIQDGSSMPTFTIKGNGYNEIGRTLYSIFEPIGANGTLAADIFIKAGDFRFELGSSDPTTMRIGSFNGSGIDMVLGSLEVSNYIDMLKIIGNKICIKGDVNYDGYDLTANGPSGPRNFHYLYETTITAPPGLNSFRYNNATQSSATTIWFSGTTLEIGDVEALLDNVDSSATLYLNNEGRTKFQQFTLSAVTPQSGYTEFAVSHVQSFGGNFIAEELVQVIFQEGTGGGGTTFPSFQLYANQLDTPNNSDWDVNAFAPVSSDSNNAGLNVRMFDDTIEEGVGFTIRTPVGASTLTFTFQSRAETAPGATRTVGINVYERDIPNNGAVGPWSSAVQLDDVSIPTNENFQTDSQTISLAALGLNANETHQIEITRTTPTGGTNLTGDWVLLYVGVEFA